MQSLVLLTGESLKQLPASDLRTFTQLMAMWHPIVDMAQNRPDSEAIAHFLCQQSTETIMQIMKCLDLKIGFGKLFDIS
jgi:hypothetical protein